MPHLAVRFELEADARVAFKDVDFSPFSCTVEVDTPAVIPEAHGYDIGSVSVAQGDPADQ
jgi:hypothetical protein